MDLVELRLLAVGGLLAVGILVSALAASAVAVAGWIGRAFHAREGHASGTALHPEPGPGAGRVRC